MTKGEKVFWIIYILIIATILYFGFYQQIKYNARLDKILEIVESLNKRRTE